MISLAENLTAWHNAGTAMKPAALLIFLVFLCPPGARAQDAADGFDTTLIHELTSNPIAGQRAVTLTAGATLQQGRTETKGWSLDGVLAHTTDAHLLLRLEAVSTTAHLRPAPGEPYLEVENNHMISGLAMRRFHRNLSWLVIAGWRRDSVLQLDYRVWAEAGVAVHLVANKSVDLFVAPMFAVGDEKRSHTDRGSNVADAGLLQTLTVRVHERFGIEQQLQTHVDTTETDDQATAFSISTLAQVAPHVGLKVYYQLRRDSLPPPGQDPTQSKAGIGVSVSFSRTPPAGTRR